MFIFYLPAILSVYKISKFPLSILILKLKAILNPSFETKATILLGETYHVIIHQSKIDSKYWYEIIINNESKLKEENTNPKSYSTVRFYTSDSFYHTFSSGIGNVCNLKIQQSGKSRIFIRINLKCHQHKKLRNM
jgi:hypothetical protein